jgi:hypothetical protein
LALRFRLALQFRNLCLYFFVGRHLSYPF